MTTDVLKLQGDYQVLTPNGNIILNATSPGVTGTVRIIGNLDVIGQTTQIESTSSLINDNIITLNAGEINSYVTLGSSGIVIDRGAAYTSSARLLYFDSKNGSTATWTMTYGTSGTYTATTFRGYWELQSSATNITALTVAAVRTNDPNSTINFLGSDNPGGMLNVKGTTNYAARVLDPNDIPNKDYIDRFATVSSTYFAKVLKVGNSFATLNDSTLLFNDPLYAFQDRFYVALGSTSNVVLNITANGSAQFSGLELNNQVIQAVNTTNDITLLPTLGNGVAIQGPLKLGEVTATITTASLGLTTIYYNTYTGGGGTGLFFVNSSRTDELVSRRKAIIYGIIF